VDTGIQRYLEAVSGVTALTRTSAERVVRQLVRQGEVASDQVGDTVQDLLDRSRRNREVLGMLVTAEVQRVVRSMGLATSDEVLALRKQVADLKRELAQVNRLLDGQQQEGA
jgi:polyhydroxyalkanoate synthesis regulator phasin